jgi:hypothetical protein
MEADHETRAQNSDGGGWCIHWRIGILGAPLAKLPHVMFFGGGVVIKLGDEVIGSIGAAGAPGAKLASESLHPPPQPKGRRYLPARGAGIYVSSAQQLSCSFTERVFGLHIAGEPRIASNINGAGQMDKLPFTIEILEFEDERSVVIDRVIGGSVYFEEAKRIGQHLLSIVDAGTRPRGYRVVSNNHELVYTWRSGDGG